MGTVKTEHSAKHIRLVESLVCIPNTAQPLLEGV